MEMINQVDINLLKSMQGMNGEELFEKIVELQKEDINACDMENVWDILHYLFTGASASEPIEGDLLSEAIVGTTLFCEDGDYIAYTYPERVAEIAKALADVDFTALLESFSPTDVEEKELYPYVWYWDKAISTKILMNVFEDVKGFYEFAAENEKAVVVTIIY